MRRSTEKTGLVAGHAHIPVLNLLHVPLIFHCVNSDRGDPHPQAKIAVKTPHSGRILCFVGQNEGRCEYEALTNDTVYGNCHRRTQNIPCSLPVISPVDKKHGESPTFIARMIRLHFLIEKNGIETLGDILRALGE